MSVEARPTLLFLMNFETPKVGIFSISRLSEFQHLSKHNYNYHDWLTRDTQSELAPSSGRAERRVNGSHALRIITSPHNINTAVPGGDPEALEHNIAIPKPEAGLAFFCSRPYNPLIYAQHLTDYSELRARSHATGFWNP